MVSGSNKTGLKIQLKILIFISVTILDIATVHAHFLVVFLESCHVLPGLRELSLLHPLSYVPMNKGTLGVHKIKLVVEPCPGFGDSGGIAEHADSPLHLGKVSSRDDGGWLVVDTNFESGRAPVDELDTTFGFDGGDGSVDVLGHNISPVEEAAGHVLTVPGVTLHHGVSWLKASVRDLGNIELLVVSLLGRDDGGIGDEGEVDAGVGNQIGLELVEVDVEGAIKPQGSRNRAYDL